MGKFLVILAYAAYAVFFARVAAHVALWFKRPWQASGEPPGGRTPSACPLLWAAALDALFLRRLFKANPAVWLGEWIFHMSFILVLIRHLRYFLTPVPEFVWRVQLAGRIAGYIMPFSVLYIVAVKSIARKQRHMFLYNYFLLATLFLISGLGVAMSAVFHPSVIAVKEFMTGALRLRAGAIPDGFPFLAHFILVLLLLVYLPTHIFAAPYTLYEARRREKTLGRILHD